MIHLLAPAFDALGSECLSGVWPEYDFAPAFALISIFLMFFAEVAAYRIGTRKLMRLGVAYSAHADDETDAHAHSHAHDPPLDVETTHAAHPGHVHPVAVPSATANDLDEHAHGHDHGEKSQKARALKEKDVEAQSDGSSLNQPFSTAEASAQVIGVAVLEFGVILHSILIGLTLAVSEEFIILFIVIIFHREYQWPSCSPCWCHCPALSAHIQLQTTPSVYTSQLPSIYPPQLLP